MTFRLVDVKKTVRSRSDGERYVHPKLLDGPSIGAQVGLALAYFNARLGRVRHEFDPEMLVRFFGDAKVARGLVACLGETYRWRPRDFAEVLTPRELARLAARGLRTPCDLRLYLYDALNAGADGFLAAEREEHLRPLAGALRLAPAKLDQLVALDAEENAVLVRVGAVPEPEEVVALYNYHAASTMLRNSAWIDLCGVVSPAARRALETACGRYAVALTWQDDDARLHNQADPFGSYARGGARVARALLAAAATAPELLSHGKAQVALGGRGAVYLLGRETAQALTGRSGVVRHAGDLPGLRDAWARHRAAEGTGGWRLVHTPEPALCSTGLALAPFACWREETRVLLWPVTSAAHLDDAVRMGAAGIAVLPLLLDDACAEPPAAVPCVRGQEPAAIVAALAQQWGSGRAEPAAQALDGLLDELHTRGFVPEAYVAEVLGCATTDDLPPRLRGIDSARATYIAGLGLCSPSFAEGMRKGLRRKPRRQPAA